MSVYFSAASWLVLGLLVIGFGWWFIMIFNGLVMLKNDAKKAWSDIDVMLKQRYDELPNVIATVKGYAKHESDVFERVTKARTEYMHAKNMNEKIEAEQALVAPMKSLFAVAESYPDLKANENFLQLQDRISSLETEIADRRELYNASVSIFNMRLESIPDVVVAKMLMLKKMEFFQIRPEEQEKPEVEMRR